ncbi:MAG: sensor histidine kinase, partial [Deltaproteobacteria bacterium]|nr:sensor histidine kinase [Deltaproteobacteria bacterium]
TVYRMSLHADYLEEPSGQWSLRQVTSPSGARNWKPWEQDTISIGFSSSAYWFRIAIDNRTRQMEWLVDTRNPVMNTAYFYETGGGAAQGPFPAGLDTPITARRVKTIVTRHLMTIPQGEVRVLYIKVQSVAPIMDLTLRPPAAMVFPDLTDNLLNGGYLGLFLAMLVYNLLAAFKYRDKKYGLYSLYILFLGGLNLSIKGLSVPFFLSHTSQKGVDLFFWSILALVALSFIFLTGFILAFLQEVLPLWEKRAVKVWLGFAILFLLACFTLDLPQAGNALNLFFMVTHGALLGASINQWRRGYRPARYLTLALVPEMIGLSMTGMALSGLIPTNFFTLNGSLFGSALEVMLFSMALTDRVNLLRQEKEAAQAKALILERLAVKRLEENVELRQAKALADTARAQAESATALKDKFVSLVAHDVRAPLSNILGVMGFLGRDPDFPLSPDEQEIITLVNKQSEYCLKMVEGLLNLEQLQKGAIAPKMQTFQAKEMVQQVFFLKTQADEKQVTLENRVPEGLILYGDRKLLAQVMQNLVTNAIKFTPAGGSVRVAASEKQTDCLTVTDSGVGINPDALPNLFRQEVRTSTQGTAGEVGFGLGLPISWEIMQAMGGQLWAESSQTPGKSGTTFFVQLPPVADDQKHASPPENPA